MPASNTAPARTSATSRGETVEARDPIAELVPCGRCGTPGLLVIAARCADSIAGIGLEGGEAYSHGVARSLHWSNGALELGDAICGAVAVGRACDPQEVSWMQRVYHAVTCTSAGCDPSCWLGDPSREGGQLDPRGAGTPFGRGD